MSDRFIFNPRSWRRARGPGGAGLRLQPRSVLELVLAGFILVGAPLMVGLLISAKQIGSLAGESEALLVQSVQRTQATREILNRVAAMERAGRQFRILRDDQAWEHFDQQRRHLRDRIIELADSELPQERLVDLAAYSEQLARVVAADHGNEVWPPVVAQGFLEFDQRAQALVADNQTAANEAIDRLKALGERSRRVVFWQLSAMIPVGVLLVIVFTLLITRPIRQLDRGIRALADPGSGRIPGVTGPRDLRALSIRLEWVRRRLNRIERDRQRLLGQVSHELKTPLSAMVEGVGLLDEELLGPLDRRQAEVTGILKANVERLQEQIESLLKFNRLQAGLKPAEHEPIAVSELVDDVLAAHRPAMIAHGIKTELQVDEDLVVIGDRDMLRTALDNLVSNSVKFSPPGARVGIFAHCQDDRVVLEVADNGPGVDSADRNRIFEPFYRGLRQEKSGVPGSGLGLAICRDLVRAHGGEVGVAARPGWRTVLKITLPTEEQGVSLRDQS